ncbi:MAG: crossover junction endodeoxyribonuclease RuvC [Candidatus Harrisonbacteria bacterium CG10_big_fil_rev_8_21_14_0_10_44_23]|uniref:Crossover junction endodeoxyribonuclease RuvC n=1 Tax=Candidatus Harrisonbacteria bacterium CG10_big_fil_rev_8_21_14_0_10_44_23 TaxID=1974585 RepID=A0A2H0UPN9_9BACT|nr:MAG: crossover junction endodeoxyribonuclease RuvC [Candidatus Harrisonbacteria bacterium CG10_big_fil_rev_8_21_14_0_10_44_23]
MLILGIDPGSTLIGYGLIEDLGDILKPVDYGVLKIKEKDPIKKINELNKRFGEILKKHRIDQVGVEKLFFSKNKKTAIEVAQAKGAILLLLQQKGMRVYEFTPNQVKQSVTGYGNADKLAVAKMVEKILNIENINEDNTADALAVAITTASAIKNPVGF